METIKDFLHKKVLVIGLGISGFAVAKLLKKLGAEVIVNEQNMLADDAEELKILQELGISYIGGGHNEEILVGIDVVVKNPGIPYYTDFIQKIIAQNIPIITEPEVAMSVCKAKVIALTATNGKTTTTMLVYEMLNNFFPEVYFAGNIGVAFSDVVQKASEDAYIVLELSSFQLKGMPTFKPDVAMILNIDEAHLDYHLDNSDYIAAKMAIFKNMTYQELLITNADDDLLNEIVEKYSPLAERLYFSLNKVIKGSYIKDNALYYNKQKVCLISDIVVPGAHNIQNVLAAITAVKRFAVSDEAIIAALKIFTGVEHRLEYVKTLETRRIYNDSKSTNVKAAQIALSAFQQPIVWIAGGLDRGNDISGLRPFCENVKTIVTFGQSQHKFEALANQMRISVAKADDLEEATKIAYDFSEVEDIILLSPACASWDQFKSFEQRGKLFKEYVEALK